MRNIDAIRGRIGWGIRRAVRGFHAFGVGSAKSGTHSIAALFGDAYASRHEPEHSPMIKAILARAEGKLDDARTAQFLRRRDRRLRLEMDCSQLNGSFVDLLPKLFPQAKFILTIRDCYTFVNSAIDHHLSRGGSETWRRMRELKFGGFTHSSHEHILQEHGLYPLDGYLVYWARHNRRVLHHVPRERLLIVRTKEIRQSIPRIARFLNVPADTLNPRRAHSYPAAQKFHLLQKLDPMFVEDRVQAHCRPLMTRFYPELASIREAAAFCRIEN